MDDAFLLSRFFSTFAPVGVRLYRRTGRPPSGPAFSQKASCPIPTFLPLVEIAQFFPGILFFPGFLRSSRGPSCPPKTMANRSFSWMLPSRCLPLLRFFFFERLTQLSTCFSLYLLCTDGNLFSRRQHRRCPTFHSSFKLTGMIAREVLFLCFLLFVTTPTGVGNSVVFVLTRNRSCVFFSTFFFVFSLPEHPGK